MKKKILLAFTFLVLAFYGFGQEVKSKAEANKKAPAEQKAGEKHTKKDGTPDKRYKENKKLKKDGTPDKRYKENKKTAK